MDETTIEMQESAADEYTRLRERHLSAVERQDATMERILAGSIHRMEIAWKLRSYTFIDDGAGRWMLYRMPAHARRLIQASAL